MGTAGSAWGGSELPEQDTEARHVVSLLGRIPNKYRDFAVPEAALGRFHSIGPLLLEEMLDAGLPHLGIGGDRRFDSLDLANIELHLWLPSPRVIAMRHWSASFSDSAGDAIHEFAIRLSVTGSANNEGVDHDFSLDRRVVQAALPESVVKLQLGVYGMKVRVDSQRYTFGPAVAAAFESVQNATFHLIPEGLQRDLGFFDDTGLGDCALATRALLREASKLEIPARWVTGLLMMTPFAVWHYWIEINVDGRWRPADPFFLRALAKWRVVDPLFWPPQRSPNQVHWKLGPRWFPMITRKGVEMPTSVTVRRLSGGAVV